MRTHLFFRHELHGLTRLFNVCLHKSYPCNPCNPCLKLYYDTILFVFLFHLLIVFGQTTGTGFLVE